MRWSVFMVYTLGCLACGWCAKAQTSYQITELSSVNLGDGRILVREKESGEPIQGEHRLVDGANSEYIEAYYKEGLMDGDFRCVKYNQLYETGSYKEGVKNGLFREYYSDGSSVKKESMYLDGQLNGEVKQFYTNGSVELERNFKNGLQQGLERAYSYPDGKITRDHHYENGKLHGVQTTCITGSVEYTEVATYLQGRLNGEFSQTYPDGSLKAKGQYLDGKATGEWVWGREGGVLLRKAHYVDDQLEGEEITYYDNGTPEKVVMYRKGKKNGLSTQYDYLTGEAKKITTYQEDQKQGPESIYCNNLHDRYWEITPYQRGVAEGVFEAYYVPEEGGKLKEKGAFSKGRRIGHWISYKPDGSVDREWDEPATMW